MKDEVPGGGRRRVGAPPLDPPRGAERPRPLRVLWAHPTAGVRRGQQRGGGRLIQRGGDGAEGRDGAGKREAARERLRGGGGERRAGGRRRQRGAAQPGFSPLPPGHG